MFSQKTPKVGSILVANPFLMDAYYKRSVILLGEHSDEGTVGFILNKPTDLIITDALEDFPEIDAPLYFGGPVQTDIIHFLHSYPQLENCKKIQEGIYWGGNLEQLKVMIETRQVTKNKIRFFAGYGGWEEDQLQSEIDSNTVWLMFEGVLKNPLEQPDEELWQIVLKKMGSKYAILANFPEDPSLN